MNHFNAIVFGSATVALTSNEDAETSGKSEFNFLSDFFCPFLP